MIRCGKNIDVDEEDYMFSRDNHSKVSVEYDEYDYHNYDDDIEDEEFRIAMEISKLEQSSGNIKDIRRINDIDIGTEVEIVLLGQEESRQRTIGTVVRVISKGEWDMDGVLVEIDYSITGRVTGICNDKFIGTKYSLSLHYGNNEEDLLWNSSTSDDQPEEQAPQNQDVICNDDPQILCPVGCGANLAGLGDEDINSHVDLCLNK